MLGALSSLDILLALLIPGLIKSSHSGHGFIVYRSFAFKTALYRSKRAYQDSSWCVQQSTLLSGRASWTCWWSSGWNTIQKKEEAETILKVSAWPVAGHYIVSYQQGARRKVFPGVSEEELYGLCNLCRTYHLLLTWILLVKSVFQPQLVPSSAERRSIQQVLRCADR